MLKSVVAIIKAKDSFEFLDELKKVTEHIDPANITAIIPFGAKDDYDDEKYMIIWNERTVQIEFLHEVKS